MLFALSLLIGLLIGSAFLGILLLMDNLSRKSSGPGMEALPVWKAEEAPAYQPIRQ